MLWEEAGVLDDGTQESHWTVQRAICGDGGGVTAAAASLLHGSFVRKMSVCRCDQHFEDV